MSKEVCPELFLDFYNTPYCLILNIIFSVNLLFNCFTIYAIVTHSPKMIRSYKWYLLSHQLISYLTDLFVSITIFLLRECEISDKFFGSTGDHSTLDRQMRFRTSEIYPRSKKDIPYCTITDCMWSDSGYYSLWNSLPLRPKFVWGTDNVEMFQRISACG